MQSTGARIGLLAGLAAVAVVLFVVLSGDDDSDTETTTTATATQTGTATQPPAEPAVTTIEVRNGKPVGGVAEIEARHGDQVRIEVVLDEPAEEVHLHGYDITEPAETSPVLLTFKADKEGIFEMEVHGHDGETQIAELTVNP